MTILKQKGEESEQNQDANKRGEVEIGKKAIELPYADAAGF